MPAKESPQRTDADQAASLARIEAGDITPEAERRLNALRDSGGAFTSDLSIADFALCHQAHLRPLAQVMGSSVYQMGYQPMGFGAGMYPSMFEATGGNVIELDVLGAAWNEARSRALVRLQREAAEVGADAVVGVQVSTQTRELGQSGGGAIEYSVVGTAVARDKRDAAQPAQRGPVLTELGVADYVKLLAAGFEPASIVGSSAVFFSTYAFGARAGLLGSSAMGIAASNFELTEYTQTIYAARARAMEAVHAQTQALGAHGVVGVRIDRRAQQQSLGNSNRTGMMVTFHVLGTAIYEDRAPTPPVPRMTMDLLS